MIKVNVFLDDKNNLLYQWDVGQKVRISGVSAGASVNFIQGTTKLTVETYESGGKVYADIPNILLQTSGSIQLLIYLTAEDYGETVYETKLMVRAREQPPDYAYTETEVKSWEDLAERVAALEDNPITSEDIGKAVESYLTENPVEATALTINIAYDEEADAWSADTDFDTIMAAYEAGRVVQANYDGALFTLNWMAEDSASFGATYSPDGTTLSWDTLMMSADGAVYFDTVDASPLVESVNGQTGAVELTAEDVGAAGAVRSAYLATNESIYNAVKDMYQNGRPQIILYHIPGYLTTDKFTFFFPSDFVDGTGYKRYRGIAVRHPDGDVYKYDSMVDWGAYKLNLTKLTAETLPNPEKLTFSGAVSAEYDGSEPVTVEIPEGGTDLSLGLTAATVGQIAKITAVDDAGKPTEWEPVELPSGDNEWERLGELDTSTAEEFVLDFDAPMKRLYILTDIIDSAGDANGASTTAYRTIWIKNSINNDYGSLKPDLGMCSHSWKYVYRFLLECVTEDVVTGGVNYGITAMTQWYVQPYNQGTYTRGYATGVKVTQTLPEDTVNNSTGTIRIWGVRV